MNTKFVLILIGMVLAALIWGSVNGRNADQWHQRATDALATSAAQRDTITAIRQRATRSAQEGLSEHRLADSALLVIQGLRGALAVAHGASVVAVARAPDTCKSVIATLESELRAANLVIANDTVQRQHATSAYKSDSAAYHSALNGLDLGIARGDNTAAVLKAAPSACRILGLLPCPVVVGAYGIGPTGGFQPFVGVGFILRI